MVLFAHLARAQTQTTAFCPQSSIQLCRLRCPSIQCGIGECIMRTGSCCDLACRPARQRDALSAGAAVKCSSGEVLCGRRGCVQPWNMPQGVNFVRDCAQGQDMTSTPNDGANNDGQLDSHGSDFKHRKEKMRFGVRSLPAHHNGPPPSPPPPSPPPSPPPIATPDPNDDPHDVPPTGCSEWYDGCNNCHREGATGPMQCALSTCVNKEKALCKQWVQGFGH